MRGIQHFHTFSDTPVSSNQHFDVGVRLKVGCMPQITYFFWGKGSNSSKLQPHFPHESFQGLLASHYHFLLNPSIFLLFRFLPRCSMYGIFTYIWVIFRANGLGRRPFLSHPGPLVRATSRAPPFRQKRWRTVWSCWTTGARWCDASPARSPTDACRGKGWHGMAGGSFQRLSYMLHGAGIFTNICPKNHPVM